MLHRFALSLLRRYVVTRRPPDVIIGSSERPYLRRWWVIPRNPYFNIYLHHFMRSDDDRALHSHPWSWNLSWLLDGAYREVLPEDSGDPSGPTAIFLRKEGQIRFRRGEAFHRVELLQSVGVPRFDLAVWTIFITGRNIREWGFACPGGFKHWKDFTAFRKQGHGNEVGPGCGDGE